MRAPRVRFRMPEHLCFDTNAAETLEVLSDLRNTLGRMSRGTRMSRKRSKHRDARPRWGNPHRDFELLKSITPAAALVLAAIYELMRIRAGYVSPLTNLGNWDENVANSLLQIGFFDIVGYDASALKHDEDANFRLLQMRSGTTADGGAVGGLIADLKGLYPHPIEATEEGMVSLYGAMVEAVGNVVGHAYPPEMCQSPDDETNRWWMTGAVDRKARWMTAVVYDQGVTIPVSLPKWARFAGFKRRLMAQVGLIPAVSDTSRDGEAICAAVEEAASSTGQAHRGNGLAQMRDFVNQCADGHLRIISRCGEVIFRPREKPIVRAYPVSIGGTLVEWNVLLGDGGNGDINSRR
jgi:hypothetical protein